MNRKAILTGLFASALTLLVAAVPAAWGQEVTLEVWLTSGVAQVQELLPQFYAAYPNIKVNVSPLSWGEYEDKVFLAFATNSAPDVIMTGASFIHQVAYNGFGLPLDRYIADWGELDDFAPGALQAMTYEGKLYGLPLMAPIRALWYRKDLFQEHGLDPEAAPQTWEEIRDAARKIVRYDGDKVTRIGMSLGEDILVHAFLTNGVKTHTEDLRRAAFNTPQGLEAMEFWTQLARDMQYLGMPLDLTGGFYGGAVGMIYGYVSPAAAAQVDPGLLDQLGGPAVMERRLKAAFTYPDWVYITTQSKHPDEAWEFIKWLTSPSNLVEIQRVGGHPSPRRSSYEHPFYDTPEGELVRRHFVEATLPYGTGFEPHPDTNVRRVRAELWPRVVSGELSPAAGLQEMETRVNAMLAEFWANR